MGRMLANLCDAVIPRSGEATAHGVETCDAGLRGLPIAALRVKPKRSPICETEGPPPKGDGGLRALNRADFVGHRRL
jgi:hypothetical protein